MKVLFLDVDGVLNTHSSGGLYTLTRSKLRRLQTVAESTGCDIVLSSTWRKDWVALRKLKRILHYRGIKILDSTTQSYFKERQVRGDEIQLWLDNHTVERYAIVDDDSDMLDSQKPYFVQTNGEVGLTDLHVDRLIELLGEK